MACENRSSLVFFFLGGGGGGSTQVAVLYHWRHQTYVQYLHKEVGNLSDLSGVGTLNSSQKYVPNF